MKLSELLNEGDISDDEADATDAGLKVRWALGKTFGIAKGNVDFEFSEWNKNTFNFQMYGVPIEFKGLSNEELQAALSKNITWRIEKVKATWIEDDDKYCTLAGRITFE